MNSFLKHQIKLKYGDWILLQEFKKPSFNCDEPIFIVQKPKLALFLKAEIYNNRIGFEYIERTKDFDCRKNYPTFSCDPEDKIEILGHWVNRPSFKELCRSYKNRTESGIISFIGGKIRKF